MIKRGDWVISKLGHGYYFRVDRVDSNKVYGNIYQPKNDVFWVNSWDDERRVKRFQPTKEQIIAYLSNKVGN